MADLSPDKKSADGITMPYDGQVGPTPERPKVPVELLGWRVRHGDGMTQAEREAASDIIFASIPSSTASTAAWKAIAERDFSGDSIKKYVAELEAERDAALLSATERMLVGRAQLEDWRLRLSQGDGTVRWDIENVLMLNPASNDIQNEGQKP